MSSERRAWRSRGSALEALRPLAPRLLAHEDATKRSVEVLHLACSNALDVERENFSEADSLLRTIERHVRPLRQAIVLWQRSPVVAGLRGRTTIGTRARSPPIARPLSGRAP
jgi:hypothetical protein